MFNWIIFVVGWNYSCYWLYRRRSKNIELKGDGAGVAGGALDVVHGGLGFEFLCD